MNYEQFASTAYWPKFENSNFPSFHDLEKTGKSRPKQYSKLTMFNFFVNWEKTGSTT